MSAATKTFLSWTGDVGVREELTKQLAKVGVLITDEVTPSTRAIAVGPHAKDGKIWAAQLYNVPQVKPDYLQAILRTGKLPDDVLEYRVLAGPCSSSSLSSMPSARRSSRRASLESCAASSGSPSSSSTSSYSFRAESKKRQLTSMPSSDAMGSHSEISRPSKRSNAALERSLSTSSLSQHSSSSSSAKKQHQHQQHDSSHIRYASPEEPGAVVALEGLIGIGKSTLCNKLLQLYPDEVDVYREETNEKFLQLFYSDPKRYGFALQWGMLKSRIYQLRLAQHDTLHGRWPHRELMFWDRSMIGDYTFALWNHLLGGISKSEMEAYESEFGGSVRDIANIGFLRDIQLFVLMNDEPARCKTRVEVNRKNASEQGIPLPYYEGLDDIHFHMFIELLRNRVAKVLIQPWGEYDDAPMCRALYEDAIHYRMKLPAVHDEPHGVKVSTTARSSDAILVYHNDKEIVKQYQLLSSAHTVAIEELKAYKDVYVPRDVLLVDPISKGVNLEHLEPYDIKFYENAYKRVVLFHLGHNQNIHFYDSKSL